MDISELTVKLLFLFLPGIITRMMVERLTVPHDRSQMYFFLHAFISGVFAYAEYGLILSSWNWAVHGKARADMRFLANLVDSSQPLAYVEVLYVCGIAIVNGFLLSALINRNLLNRLARALRVTKKFGDLDVWGYVCNSPIDSLKWVRLRDHRHDLCYEGWVEAFSDTNAGCEVFIREVKVFKNESGELLYEVPGVYIALDPKDATIEFYALDMRESENLPKGGEADVIEPQAAERRGAREHRSEAHQTRRHIQGRPQSSSHDSSTPV